MRVAAQCLTFVACAMLATDALAVQSNSPLGNALDGVSKGDPKGLGKPLYHIIKGMTKDDVSQLLDEVKKDFDRCNWASVTAELKEAKLEKLNGVLSDAGLSLTDIGDELSDQRLLRICLFLQNHDLVESLNTRNGTKAQFGLNPIALFSGKEFQKHLTGLHPRERNNTGANSASFVQLGGSSGQEIGVLKPSPYSNSGTLLSTYDWVGTAVSTVVQNQESCGGCWAFSASECIAAVNWIQNQMNSGNQSVTTVLSAQQLISCDTESGNNGCNGGNYENVWLNKNAYSALNPLVSTSSYPFSDGAGTTSSCSATQSTSNPLVKAYGNTALGSFFGYATNQDMYEAILQNPMSIGISASSPCFKYYSGGLLTVDDCSTVMSQQCSLDHAVLLVGVENYGTSNMAFKIKNSWSDSWGSGGYVYFANNYSLGDYSCYGMLGMNMMPAFPSTTVQVGTESPSAQTTDNPSSGSAISDSIVFSCLLAFAFLI